VWLRMEQSFFRLLRMSQKAGGLLDKPCDWIICQFHFWIGGGGLVLKKVDVISFFFFFPPPSELYAGSCGRNSCEAEYSVPIS